MDFADESYVRLYTRKTLTWKLLGWEGRAVMMAMLSEFDRSGIFNFRADPASSISAVTDVPVDVVRVGLQRLIDTETWHLAESAIVWPSFVEAQAVVRGPKERQRECRERKRDMVRAGLDPQQRAAVVYFIQSELGGPIKIGRAGDLAKRLSNLATGRADTLKVLAAFNGTLADELKLHSLLAAFRLKGEWFADCPEVLEVAAYADNHGPAVMAWLASRDMSQAVTGHTTGNGFVTSAEPILSDPIPSKPSLVPERASECPTHRRIPKDWKPSEAFYGEALTEGVPKVDLDQDVTYWRARDLGGEFHDLEEFFRSHFARLRKHRETEQFKATQQTTGRAFGKGASPVLEPTQKHVAYAKAKGVDLSAILTELNEMGAVESFGLMRAKEMIGERLSLAARKQAM